MDKLALLKEFFGHEEFRTGQEKLVDTLLAGQDVLGVMPTGAGKSLCYQLPALMLPGVALVVSPLISLMKDQVAALFQAGVPAAYLNSSLSFNQYGETLRRMEAGRYKLVYVAPERLMTPEFLQIAQQMEISLVAVDEAHCVSQWGQDFRPSYLQIAAFLEALPQRPVVGAFTATATHQVKEDIEKLLILQSPLRITTGFDRPNLFFEVIHTKQKDAYLKAYLARRPEESGIVYCATRKTVESVCQALSEAGVQATRYHAGLSDQERKQNQEDFVNDRSRVMVATNAFGMGIDKSNVSFVVHYNMPKNIESYYQEAGRAGRDGERARCTLLFSAADIVTARFLIEHSSDNEALSEEEREHVRLRELRRLNQMAEYCKTTGCLRAYLLRYFGDTAPDKCDDCGNCLSELKKRDITVEAQKILSGVARVERKYRSSLGISMIIRMLSGGADQKLRQLGLDQLPTYGIMKDVDRAVIRDYIDFLVLESYLRIEGDEYPVLRLGRNAKRALFQGEPVLYAYREQEEVDKKRQPKRGKLELREENHGLFEALRTLRAKLAAEQEVPAYVICSNATLTEMAERQPEDMEAFHSISGIGRVKADKYGRPFLERILRWKEENER